MCFSFFIDKESISKRVHCNAVDLHPNLHRIQFCGCHTWFSLAIFVQLLMLRALPLDSGIGTLQLICMKKQLSSHHSQQRSLNMLNRNFLIAETIPRTDADPY